MICASTVVSARVSLDEAEENALRKGYEDVERRGWEVRCGAEKWFSRLRRIGVVAEPGERSLELVTILEKPSRLELAVDNEAQLW